VGRPRSQFALEIFPNCRRKPLRSGDLPRLHSYSSKENTTGRQSAVRSAIPPILPATARSDANPPLRSFSSTATWRFYLSCSPISHGVSSVSLVATSAFATSFPTHGGSQSTCTSCFPVRLCAMMMLMFAPSISLKLF
jgi:hypothetical protein